MGKEKAGFLTPKAIGNRIKAKGLQKLRWYCQMCQKQCRDENGFKCHISSESHQRQLLLVADNPDKFVDTFSKEFCETFLELVKRRFGTKRVHANVVYQEYIADRNHTHMNSTQWETLTEFVKWVGREGFCTVDETEKGWFLQYIDKDPEAIRRQEAHQKKEKMDLDDEEKKARFIQLQIERAAATEKISATPVYTDLQKQSEDEKVVFKIPAAVKSSKPTERSHGGASKSLGENPLKLPSKSSRDDDARSTISASSSTSSSSNNRKRKSALEEIIEMEEEKKGKTRKKDYWLVEGIVVKIVTKKVGEKFYKKKGVVTEVINKYGGVIKLLDSSEKLKLDQAHLETVIPSIGRAVMIVNGAYCGERAVLQSIDEANFCCSIVLQSGPSKGRLVEKVQYEDICKLHQPSDG